jgi:zinc protease
MRRIVSIIIALALLWGASVHADTKDIKLPPYKEHKLDNGLRVFIVRTDEVPLVTMRLLLPAGSSLEKEGKDGVANLTADLLIKGAAGRGAEEISETIEGVGGELEAYAGRDVTVIAGSFLSRDFDLGLKFLADLTIRPDFPEEEFGREKEILLAQLVSVKENPYAVANREFVKQLLGDHPYADPVNGYRSTVEKLTRDDIVRFHDEHYRPGGSVLAVVGDVKEKETLKKIEKAMGKWKAGDGAPATYDKLEPSVQSGRRVVVINKPDVTQSQIRIGNIAVGLIAVGLKTPDYFELAVANSVLGGGFTSRLMDEIRVNRGLSYGARSSLAKYHHGGYFGVYTYTKNGTLRETIDVALEQVDLMRDEMVGDEELEGVRRYISGLFPFDLETNDDLAGWLTVIAYYDLGTDLVEKYRSRIGEVNSSDVQRVARKHFHSDDNLILVLTNYEETKDQLEGLGTIELIEIDDLE